jgi:hypothetical protein
MNRPHSAHEKGELIRVLVKEAAGQKSLEEPNNGWKIDIKPNVQEVRFCNNVSEYELNCTVIKPLLACV